MSTPRTAGRLGRKPNSGKPRVTLLSPDVPTTYSPPPTLDRYSAVAAALWGMDGNDDVGDCTIADGDHEVKSAQAAAGNPVVQSTTAEVLAIYSAVTGYDPSQTQPDGSNPTDQGAEMQDVRSYWQKNGFTLGGQVHKILLFAELGLHTNLLKWALDQFGVVGLGADLPNSAMDQFNAGQPWDVVPDDGGIDGGHAFAFVGYDAQYLYVLTWEKVQKVTWAWFAKYVREAWTALDEDFVNAHTGLDPLAGTLYALGQQFTAVTGKPNPVPPPTPVPAPTPTPSPDVHMDSADEALLAALTPWLREHHVGANERAVHAVAAWATAKQGEPF